MFQNVIFKIENIYYLDFITVFMTENFKRLVECYDTIDT